MYADVCAMAASHTPFLMHLQSCNLHRLALLHREAIQADRRISFKRIARFMPRTKEDIKRLTTP